MATPYDISVIICTRNRADSLKETLTCLSRCDRTAIKVQIIVVDNGSENNSGQDLSERYKNNDKITVLLNQKNLGFAQGNNVGFNYAKYHLNAHFIVLINNDTIIKQKNFIEIIVQKYKETSFHVLGPDIISTINGQHQNPCRSKFQEADVLRKFILNNQISLILNYLLLDKIFERIKK